MASANRTLPLANTVVPGTRQRVVNHSGSTTLNVVASGADSIAVVGNSAMTLSPLQGLDFESDGVSMWYATSEIQLTPKEIYDGGALTNVTGTTQVPLTWSSLNLFPGSIMFTAAGGNLTAIRPVFCLFNFTFTWTADVGQNSDAGLVLQPVLRSGTGTVSIDIFGQVFQTSRSGTYSFGGSHFAGFMDLAEGDVIGLDASDYAGQGGDTDLVSLRAIIEDR